jgi:hypothetical protein
MDDQQFDGWTRRRAGLGVGALAAGLLTAVSGNDVRAKKKRKPCRKVDVCPQRICCGCENNTCTYFFGDEIDGFARCTAFCEDQGSTTRDFFAGSRREIAVSCDIVNRCTALFCPIAS